MTLKALVCEVQMETNLVCYLPLNRSFKLQKSNVLKHKKYFKFTKHICKQGLILCLKYKMFCTMQNTVVLWSNLSCVRLEGWGFRFGRPQKWCSKKSLWQGYQSIMSYLCTVKMLKKIIWTGKRHATPPFDGQNTQHYSVSFLTLWVFSKAK